MHAGGGIGWTGTTTCVSGYYCNYSNAYYSQCIPGTASSTSTSVKPTSTSSTSTSNPSSTSSTAQPTSTGGPNYWFSLCVYCSPNSTLINSTFLLSGDSYTATGFSISGTPPSVGNPLGNPTYPGSTTTGGENWIDAATTKTNHSLILTYNFAYSGATIDAALVAPFDPSIRSLVDQVTQFTTWSAAKNPKPWTSSNALFSIWIGINDIGSTYSQSSDRAAFSDKLLADEFAQVQKLVSAAYLVAVSLCSYHDQVRYRRTQLPLHQRPAG